MLENEQLHWKKVAVGKAPGRFIPGHHPSFRRIRG